MFRPVSRGVSGASAPVKTAQVHARLVALIDSLPEGAALPSERDLAARWGVSRVTLRRATDTLALEGLVERRHGSGTYTCRPKLRRQLTMTSFTEDMRRRGMVAGSQLLQLTTANAGTRIGRLLCIPATDPVTRFTRLRTGDGEPMSLETTWIPAALAPDIAPTDLDGSWYEALSQRYGIHIIAGDAVVEPALPDRRAAQHLQIDDNQPCFRVRTTSRDEQGHIVEIGSVLYRGDRYTITADLSLPSAPRPRLKGARR